MITLIVTSCNKNKVVVIEKHNDGTTKVMREYFKNDTLNYLETQYYNDGNKLLEGKCVNGERNGTWKAWYRDGKLWSEGDFDKGINHGEHFNYYEDGTLRYSGNYYEGKRTGIWKFYDTLGILIETREYPEYK
ncbi:hypothetical protein LJC69_01850 [Bacteroidales bacterium OttesenSCG-928-K22]|nr:hypothetical protein [Bacteroidales bacterium OttesenSCG-928-K22]